MNSGTSRFIWKWKCKYAKRHCRSLAVKDDFFCLFEGVLDNLGSLRHQYGLPKSTNEVLLVIEAYKALRDRAPFPINHVVGHLSGSFAFILFDNSTSTLFVASVTHFHILFPQIKPTEYQFLIAILVDFVFFAGSVWEGAFVLGNHCRWIRRVRRWCRSSQRRLWKIPCLVSSR